MAIGFCPACGTPRTGDRFCSKCGNDFGKAAEPGAASPPQPDPEPAKTAMQGLAQAGLEVQNYNLALVVGRVVGFVVAMAVLFFIVGPMFGTEGVWATIIAFFVLAFLGLFLGQWVALQIMRR